MHWSNSDPLWDWVAVPSGLTSFFGLPLEPFCRDLLLVAEEGAQLPFLAIDVEVPLEPLVLCRAGGELAAAFPDGR